jgi:hypothetical protein
MEVVEISGQWYIARNDPCKPIGLTIIAGPYAEKHWAIAVHRINEID